MKGSPEQPRFQHNPEYFAHGQKYVPGILGGMGPEAHRMFEGLMIEASNRHYNPVMGDQRHPVYTLDSASSTPDRTRSLRGTGPDATGHLKYFARHLEMSGVDFILITCNTAHGYEKQVQAAIEVPLVSLIENTVDHVEENYKGTTRVGVLATDGTIGLGLYQQALERRNLTPVFPEVGSPVQQKVMDAIYNDSWGIKNTGTTPSERAKSNLMEAAEWCRDQGAEVIVEGCTEIPLALTKGIYSNLPLVDPMEAMAITAVEIAFGERPLPSKRT